MEMAGTDAETKMMICIRPTKKALQGIGLQRKRRPRNTWRINLEKQNVDSRIQAQLEE